MVEVPERQPQSVQAEVGIDLGLTHLAVLSTGEKIDNPRHVQAAARKLARAQRAFARTEKGSANREKARRRVARLHARVADRRNDFLHKLTTRITSENQAVYVEDLGVAGMARSKLARGVRDAAWSKFRHQCRYKQQRNGHYFGLHPRFERSSGVCPTTGALASLTLKQRHWDCPCGQTHDRDIAAAQIILARGRRERLNACRGDVSLGSAELSPVKQEQPSGLDVNHSTALAEAVSQTFNCGPLDR